jgi:predicted membrane-bound spermidine synthase
MLRAWLVPGDRCTATPMSAAPTAFHASHDPAEQALITRRLAPAFFASGVAALIYQICWQRLLFTSLGVDIESVTVIVSVFMLGLGLGALAGGQLADRLPRQALLLFALAEALIGLYGWFSPELLRGAATLLIEQPRGTVAVANFLLLLPSTCLMGATLPILVAHVTRVYGNVGQAIGLLYQANTLGAAIGVALVGFVWFLLFDLDAAIRFAALLNLAVSALTLRWLLR